MKPRRWRRRRRCRRPPRPDQSAEDPADRRGDRRDAPLPAQGRRRLRTGRRRRRQCAGQAVRRLRRLPDGERHHLRRSGALDRQARRSIRVVPVEPHRTEEQSDEARLSRQQCHHPRRSGSGRGHAALLHRAVRQSVVDARLRRRGRRGGEDGARRSCRRCSAPSTTTRSSSPRAARKRQHRHPVGAGIQPDRNEIVTSKVEHPAVLALCQHLEKTAAPRSITSASIRWAASISRPIAPRSRTRRPSSRSCGRTTRPARSFRSKGWPSWPRSRRAVPHRRGAGGRQGADRSSRTARSTCCRCPATSCTRPRASARSTCKRGVRFKPLLRGGHQERGRRAGTENAPAIIALGKAAELALEHMRRSRRA